MRLFPQRIAGLLALTAFSACGESQLPPAMPSPPPPSPPSEVTISLERVGCDDLALELVLPFYEGLRVTAPKRAMTELGLERVELVYPSPLSIPAVAWRCPGQSWNVVGAAIEDAPLTVRLERSKAGVDVRLACFRPCNLHTWSIRGGIAELGAAMGRLYARAEPGEPLAQKFDELRFYVHDFVSDEEPALRTDWQLDALSAELAETPPRALAFVYGWDPSSVDLGGRTFWSEGAEDDAKSVLAQSSAPSHLAWLNLRTFKRQIPKLEERVELSEALAAARWQGPKGENSIEQYAFEGVEMCLASRAWQDSRKVELERLAALGFRVVQLDEFPIATRWHAEPCVAQGHEHLPGDFAGEWQSVLAFTKELGKRADELGVLLTSEEPSAALIGVTRGYVDRIANEEPDIYGFWTRSPNARPVPLFSAAFASQQTPYTDVDPGGMVPAGWLVMKKRSPPGLTPASDPTPGSPGGS